MKRQVALLAVLTLLASGPSASAASVKGNEQRIQVNVTSKGFEPSTIRVKAGQPVVLVVTRKAEKTCANEIVIKDLKMRRALPLNRTIEIRLDPMKPGTLRYACGMDMLAGHLLID
jgi:Uncharacterized protein conserved in bacteria